MLMKLEIDLNNVTEVEISEAIESLDYWRRRKFNILKTDIVVSDFISQEAPQIIFSEEDFVENITSAIENNNGLDSTGLPWDERIHSSSKAKGKDGKWRQRRGVDINLVRIVEAELLRNPENTSNSLIPSIPLPPIGGSLTYIEMIQLITPAINKGLISSDKLLAILNSHNISNLVDLARYPETFPQVAEQIKQEISNGQRGTTLLSGDTNNE